MDNQVITGQDITICHDFSQQVSVFLDIQVVTCRDIASDRCIHMDQQVVARGDVTVDYNFPHSIHILHLKHVAFCCQQFFHVNYVTESRWTINCHDTFDVQVASNHQFVYDGVVDVDVRHYILRVLNSYIQVTLL